MEKEELKIKAPESFKRKWIENPFETLLFQSRFLILIPVLGILIASVLMVVKGSCEIIQGSIEFVRKFSGFQQTSLDDSVVILSFIPAIDNYLFAIILLLISMGLYELFVSEINPDVRKNETQPNWLMIKSFEDLKYQIGEVIIMILIVNLFKWSYKINYSQPIHLLILGGAIFLVAGTLVVTHYVSGIIKKYFNIDPP